MNKNSTLSKLKPIIKKVLGAYSIAVEGTKSMEGELGSRYASIDDFIFDFSLSLLYKKGGLATERANITHSIYSTVGDFLENELSLKWLNIFRTKTPSALVLCALFIERNKIIKPYFGEPEILLGIIRDEFGMHFDVLKIPKPEECFSRIQ